MNLSEQMLKSPPDEVIEAIKEYIDYLPETANKDRFVRDLTIHGLKLTTVNINFKLKYRVEEIDPDFMQEDNHWIPSINIEIEEEL